jgi:hypothetical protein
MAGDVTWLGNMSPMLRDKVLFPVARRHVAQKLKSEQHSRKTVRTCNYQFGRKGNCVYCENRSAQTNTWWGCNEESVGCWNRWQQFCIFVRPATLRPGTGRYSFAMRCLLLPFWMPSCHQTSDTVVPSDAALNFNNVMLLSTDFLSWILISLCGDVWVSSAGCLQCGYCWHTACGLSRHVAESLTVRCVERLCRLRRHW